MAASSTFAWHRSEPAVSKAIRRQTAAFGPALCAQASPHPPMRAACAHLDLDQTHSPGIQSPLSAACQPVDLCPRNPPGSASHLPPRVKPELLGARRVSPRPLR